MPYKLTDRHNQSCWVHGKASVKYSTDEWSEAPEWLAEKGYHLTYFDDLWIAESWLSIADRIWLVDIEGKVSLPRMAAASAVGDGFLKLGGPDRRNWPKGTRMAKRIILRELVLVK